MGDPLKVAFFGWTAHEKTLTIDNLVIQGPILVKCCCIYKCGWETDTHLLILIHLVISLVIVELWSFIYALLLTTWVLHRVGVGVWGSWEECGRVGKGERPGWVCCNA